MTVLVKGAAVWLAMWGGTAAGQALSVVPVNVFFAPGQNAKTLMVTNRSDRDAAIQIRSYTWNQPDGNDQLDATHALVISPPIVTIPAGASQLVRLLLKQPAAYKEATYRIILDELPPPPEDGVIHVVFRLSIPVFSQPAKRAVPQLQFHVECADGQVYLVAVNQGLRHEAIRDIELSTAAGGKLKPDSGSSPYILAGATRRWHVAAQGFQPQPDDTLKLTAHADAGTIEQQIRVAAKP